MYVLITYDINTESQEGKRRLRNVAKICQNYGQRVQNSVFECKVDEAQLLIIKRELARIIEPTKDSLRYYRLGKNYAEKVEHVGAKPSYSLEEALIV